MSKKLYESDVDKLYKEVFGSDSQTQGEAEKVIQKYETVENVQNDDCSNNMIGICLGIILGTILYILF